MTEQEIKSIVGEINRFAGPREIAGTPSIEWLQEFALHVEYKTLRDALDELEPTESRLLAIAQDETRYTGMDFAQFSGFNRATETVAMRLVAVEDKLTPVYGEHR